MNDVLEDRLTDLFERVGDAVSVEDRLGRVDAGALESNAASGFHRRPWILVAAAVVALAGSAGVVRVVDDRAEERSVAEQPEPPEPLYLLPTGLPSWTSGNGSTSSGSAGSYQGIVFAIHVDGMFMDPAVATLTADPPDGFSTETWREVSYNGELVFLSPEVRGAHNTVTQHVDAGWLTSSSHNPAPNVAAIDAVEVDATGTLRLESPGIEVIATYDIPAGIIGTSTYSEANGPGNQRVVVETVSGEIPLVALVADRAYHLEAITVNGNPAWRASGFDVDGEWHAIGWEFDRLQSVFVSNHSSFEELLAVAESLEVVDEATWTAATS